jgi:hypothetical protein
VFGFGLLTWMLIDKLRGIAIGNRPALLAGILFVLVGVQLVSLGLLAELIVSRTRQRERNRPPISASGGFDTSPGPRSVSRREVPTAASPSLR